MLFESLDHDERKRAEHRSGAHAIIAANQKVATNLKPYLAVAADSPSEYTARLEYVTSAVEGYVRDVCAEYEADFDHVLSVVMNGLRYACKDCGCDCSSGKCDCSDCGTCGNKESNTKWSAPHPDDCGCNFPACVKKRDGQDPEPENITAEARTAADVETGDTFTQERVTLPKGNEDGHSQTGSPKIDKSPVPKDGLKPVDVPSKNHPSEMQDIEQQADYDTQTTQGANPTPDTTRSPRERVDADSPMQPAETHGPHTKTFPDKGQADPVTSKWTVEGGQPEANV